MVGQALGAAVAAVAYFAAQQDEPPALRAADVRDLRALGKACVNGSSELMTEVAASVVSTLYNYQLHHASRARTAWRPTA